MCFFPLVCSEVNLPDCFIVLAFTHVVITEHCIIVMMHCTRNVDVKAFGQIYCDNRFLSILTSLGMSTLTKDNVSVYESLISGTAQLAAIGLIDFIK